MDGYLLKSKRLGNPGKLSEQLGDMRYRLNEYAEYFTGKRIGVTAGSRDIANAPELIKAITEQIQKHSGSPVIIAAMGSHGDATVSGQLAVLASLGISEEDLDMPVIAAENWPMVELPNSNDTFPVNEAVLSCDGIILFNRVKPHTSFHGEIESGLCKMMTVGLGGPEGAKMIHSRSVDEISPYIESAAAQLIEALPIICGIAVIENQQHKIESLDVLSCDRLIEDEKKLLRQAKVLQPCIPVEHADLLIVDEIGKCFSGTGMDTNIIGRLRIRNVREPEQRFNLIYARRLSERAKGNGYGIGLADITVRRLAESIDWSSTFLNAITSGFTMRVMLPLVLEDDTAALSAAARILGKDLEELEILRIKNTLDLETIWINSTLYDKNKSLLDSDYNTIPRKLELDDIGDLKPMQ